MGKSNLNFDEVKARIEDAAYNAVFETAKAIETKAKALAPVRKVYEPDKSRKRSMSRAEKAEVISIFRTKLSFESPEARNKAINMVRQSGSKTSPNRRQASRAAITSRRGFVETHEPFPKGGRLQVGRGFYKFQDYYKLSRQGRYELKRGIKDYGSRGGRQSVIRVEIDQGGDRTVVARGGFSSMPIGEGVSIHSGATKMVAYNVGKKTGLGYSYAIQLGGRLKRDIEIDDKPVRVGDLVTASVVSKAPYSRYVEFPTSRTAAQPFMRPALKANRSRLLREMKKAYREG